MVDFRASSVCEVETLVALWRPRCCASGGTVSGGWYVQPGVTNDFLQIWNTTVNQEAYAGGFEGTDLLSLGTPLKVETQVVAGINFRFKFADGTSVTVWQNPGGVLEITELVKG